jgi:hypothetical protein
MGRAALEGEREGAKRIGCEHGEERVGLVSCGQRRERQLRVGISEVEVNPNQLLPPSQKE